MDNDVEKWRKQVDEKATAENFESSSAGELIIKWLNAEIVRLTNSLVNDDELDADNAKRAGIRGELKAYQLIGNKLRVTKLQGTQAEKTLEANGIEVKEQVDQRTPEQIAEDAGL